MNRNIAVILAGRDAGLARTLGAASGALDGFNRKIDQANNRSQKMAAFGKLAFQALAVAAVIALGAAVKMAVDFQVQMQNVETVMHAGEAGIRSMSDAVLDMASRVPQSTGTLAKGLYDIASSGIYGADALNVLEVSAKAASAGLSTTAVASKAIVGVLNAYGLEARDAADVSDILFQTVELGVVTFEELASQLGDVIGAAAAAGIEFDEVGSAVATMTLAGINAGESVTSLNRLIQKLIKPGKGLAEAYRKMGFESGKAALDQLGLFGVMEKIRQATGGQIQELVKLFPEIRAARGAYALMAAGGQHYARVQSIITNEQTRAGATQRAFDTQMKAVGNQFKILTNQVQVFGIRVGTKFLPAVAEGIRLARQFGSTLGDGFTALGRMARPVVEELGDALSSLIDFFKVLGQTASPVFRALATFTAGAAIASLMALAQVLETVTGFLAEHPGLVRALAIAYGGVLIGNLLAAAGAFLKVQAGLLAIRAGLAGLTAQAVIVNILTRLQALGMVIFGLAPGVNIIGNLKVAFAGLGTAMSSPALAGTAIVAAAYAIQTGFDKARQSADKMVSSITQKFDLTTIEGLHGAIQELDVAIASNNEEWDKMGSSDITKTLRGTAQLLTPMKNDVIDNAEAFKKLNAEMDRLSTTSAMFEHDLATISNNLGISTEQVEKFLKKLDYDPTDTQVTTTQLTEQIRELMAAAQAGTPATDSFVGALEAVADPATSATDQVKALDDAIKGLIGTALGMSDATIAWEASVDDLTQAVKDNGLTLDLNTEKGRAVASAINDAAKAAIDHANATASMTGNIKDGVDVLAMHREQLVGQLQELGFSKQAAIDYVNALGLTPDNISTLVELENAQSAMLEVEEFQYLLGLVNDSETKAKVDIDSTKFDDDYLKIAQALIQIELANPEAEVLLNGEKFTPTAEMVQAWAAAWDMTTPEAKALLNIIDPQHKFTSLQEAAMKWEKASPEADAKLNSARANAEFEKIERRAGVWARKSVSARAGLVDAASAGIDRILRKMAMIKDKTVTVTVRGSGGPSRIERLGGMVHARTGYQAGIYDSPTVFFGERGTGGEAYVPRYGNKNRSTAILARAASWYGMEVRPRGTGGDGSSVNDFSTTVSVTIKAQGSITDQKGLVGHIENVVRSELDAHDKKLRRELASR